MDASNVPPDGPPKTQRTPLRPALRALAERESAGPHLNEDELIAYYESKLPGDRAESARDHLVRCRECADLLLDLSSFAGHPLPPGTPQPTPAEVEASWRELAPRIASLHSPGPLRAWSVSRALPWALAAAALLASIGLGLGMAHISRETTALRRRVQDLSQPRADAVIAELSPPEEGRTRSGEEPAVKTFEAGRPIWLILQPHLTSSFASYQLEIRGMDGRVYWHGEGRRTDQDTFRLDLSAGWLPPGPYRIVLYGIEGSQRKALTGFAFAIVAH